ncbi:unnamed protein product, partial [Symbiodinium sp. CCMP2592]
AGADWLDGQALLGIEAARAPVIWNNGNIYNQRHILYDAYQFRGAVPVGDELLEACA